MGEYEPRDSRDVTLKQGNEPGSAERTGPKEDEVRREAIAREKAEDKKASQTERDDAARQSQYDPAERTSG